MNEARIVAIDPTSHGFCFVVFEGPWKLIDWGHAHVRPATAVKCLERSAELLAWYVPSVVALEDWNAKGARRGLRVKHFLTALSGFVESSGGQVDLITKHDIKRVFSPNKRLNKHEVATYIAAAFPELAPKLPPPRKIWMSEDERMSLFDASALALTHFYKPEEVEEIEA